MKKVLVSGYLGFNNFGDEAIFYALAEHLKNSNVEISALSNNPKETSEKYNVKTYYFKNLKTIIKAIRSNDILISGGGSLLQDKTSNFSLYYYLFIVIIAKLFFKKVIIFAQGFEPLKNKFNELILKLILKTTDFITVRDEKSKQYLKKLGIDSILLTDPIYSIIDKTEISNNKEGLIVQLRKTKHINNAFIKNLANQISKNFNEKISVLSLQDSMDLDICKELQNELKTLNIESVLIEHKTIKETIDIINKAEFMISTRLHGAIVSNALKTKTFTLNYDEKLKTLSDEFLLPNINLDSFSYERLNEKLDDFFNTKTEIEEYRKFDWNEIDSFINSIREKK